LGRPQQCHRPDVYALVQCRQFGTACMIAYPLRVIRVDELGPIAVKTYPRAECTARPECDCYEPDGGGDDAHSVCAAFESATGKAGTQITEKRGARSPSADRESGPAVSLRSLASHPRRSVHPHQQTDTPGPCGMDRDPGATPSKGNSFPNTRLG
jgi:hypothetical protein